MKKILLFILLIILILGILFFWYHKTQTKYIKLSAGNQPEPSSASTSAQVNGQLVPKLKNLEIKQESPTKYSLKSLNNDLVELGTERHSPASPTPVKTTLINKFINLGLLLVKNAEASQGGPAKPFLKLHKWDSEVSLKVNIPYNIVSENPDTTGGKLTYTTVDNEQAPSSGSKKIEFLAKAPEEITEKDSKGNEHRYTINEDGGVEFNVILNEKPATNSLVFPIETQNLDFFYQPPLDEGNKDPNLTCVPTECKDKDGNIAVFRPENVVGSYAVYYKDNKSGDFSKMGGKNYMTGKAFHIYRPKIWDSAGKEVWGELKIDETIKTLTVTVGQKFLDEAVYPVTVDPNFGYEGVGVHEFMLMAQ